MPRVKVLITDAIGNTTEAVVAQRRPADVSGLDAAHRAAYAL